MKKRSLSIFVILVMVLGLMAAGITFADSADDYKVIKRAVKSKKGGELNWFKVSIYDKIKKKNVVSIKLPLLLAETFADCDDKIKVKDGCDLDIKKLLRLLKKSGSTSLVEIDGDDAAIKIWLE